MTDSAPLILTLGMDQHSFAFFDEQRRTHFPSERNFIPAHITLFHHLFGKEEASILHDLHMVAGRRMEVGLQVNGLRFLGRGVAYSLYSPEYDALRQELSQRWSQWLTPQDRQRLKPHITVQNKAEPEAARQLLQELEAQFTPFVILGKTLELWRYRNGPWEHVRTIPLQPWSETSG